MASVDKKLAAKEKRSAERRERLAQRLNASTTTASSLITLTVESDSSQTIGSAEEDDESDADTDFTCTAAAETSIKSQRLRIISPTVSAVLDRTNTSIRKSAMILASVVNEAGSSTSSAVLSKSTVHRQRQLFRQESADKIKANYYPVKSVVHWDGKLLPDVTGEESDHVDRLPVLLSSLEDGSNKLLGVPKLPSGSGKVTADAVLQELASWECVLTRLRPTQADLLALAPFWNIQLVAIFSGWHVVTTCWKFCWLMHLRIVWDHHQDLTFFYSKNSEKAGTI